MSCLLYVNDEESSGKINIDDLYEKKQRRDLKQLSIFNKILNRIHTRIKIAGRQNMNDKHVWFTVPAYIFGEPNYDKADCIAYLVTKLEDNGFVIQYVHPNTLFVSWQTWVPSYIRNELKRKTGIMVDQTGNIVEKKEDKPETKIIKDSKYTPINTYKPTGNLVYNNEMFEKIEKKVQFTDKR